MRRSLLLSTLLVLSGCNGLLGIPKAKRRAESSSAMAGAGGAAECESSAECLSAADAAEDPKVCRGGRCVPLLLPDCPLVVPQTNRRWLDNLRAPGAEPLVIGAFAPIGTTKSLGPALDTYELALNEVSNVLGGVPVLGGAIRPVVALVCRNDFATPSDLDRAVDHLVDDVEVPAVLSSLGPDDLARAFERSKPRSVFYMNVLDADPSLTSTPHDGLLWHMLPDVEVLADAYVALFDRTLRHLARTGVLAEGEPARVALVNAYDLPSAARLGTAVTERLSFNGKGAQDNAADGRFAIANVRTSLGASGPIDYSFAIQGIRNLAPHVVIATDPGEFLDSIMPGLEAGTSDPKPFYLLSPWHLRPFPLFLVPTSTQLRVAGINYAGAPDPSADLGYLKRFADAFPYVDGAVGLENFYDAAYYVLYSTVAARGNWPLRGPDLGLGIEQLLSGSRTFTVGPDDLLAGMGQLALTGASATLNGTLGPPSFDPRTGVRADNGSVWCVDAHDATPTDVLRLDGSGKLVGSFPCFDFDD